MPHCKTGKNGVNHFYRTYGLTGTHWLPQVKCLTGTGRPNDGAVVIRDGHEVGRNDIEVCTIDNRGVGSFFPTKKSSYSTTRMAKDATAIMDHLGWKEAHVFGHSTEFLSDSVVG